MLRWKATGTQQVQSADEHRQWSTSSRRVSISPTALTIADGRSGTQIGGLRGLARKRWLAAEGPASAPGARELCGGRWRRGSPRHEADPHELGPRRPVEPLLDAV